MWLRVENKEIKMIRLLLFIGLVVCAGLAIALAVAMKSTPVPSPLTNLNQPWETRGQA